MILTLICIEIAQFLGAAIGLFCFASMYKGLNL